MRVSKPKLLILSDFFYPHWTGIAKSMYYFVNAMGKELDITVLTVKFQPNLKKEETIFSAHVIREEYLFPVSRSKYSLQIIYKFLYLVRGFDIILINSPFTNILPIACIARLFRKKLLILHHGDLILSRGITNKIVEKIFDISSYVGFFVAHKVSTFTYDYARSSRVLKPHMKKFSPILIPITKTEGHQIERTKSSAFETLRELKRQKKTLYGFAGRFVEEKGFDILFDAIPEIISRLPHAHFVFAGETDIKYENFFQRNTKKLQRVSRHITFLGLLDESELDLFYTQIEYIILPSRSDCFPLVQVEAMLVKTPAIVSDIPGASYLVKQTGFGVLFKKGDPTDLAEKIITAPQKKALQKYHKHVLKLLDSKKNVAQIKEFITS